MKRRKRIISVILVLISVLLMAAGCQKEEDPADAEYTVFYINQEGTGLVEAAYHGEMDEPNKAVEEMLECLKKTSKEIEEQPAIPAKAEIQSYTLDDEKLCLYFNDKYLTMDTVQEVLCRAALVRSLTQINGVDLVAFYVEDKPLTNKEGAEYGYMQAEDFVANTGSSINSYQVADMTLYFANGSGDKLVEEKVSVRFNTNQSLERVIVEQLMKGPSSDKHQATISKKTKLLGVSIKEGICYLNFDEGLKETPPGVLPKTVIYSIVNSVAEIGNVGSVQIAINGESNMTFQESVKLGEPLSRNLDIVEEE